MNLNALILLGKGCNRKTYLLPSGKNVIKIPFNDDGYLDNIMEAEQAYKDNWLLKTQKARCKLLKNGWLVMEYVKSIYELPDQKFPQWIYGVDSCQVGYTLDGRLV